MTVRRWGLQGEQWQHWLRSSPVGLDLFHRWQEAGEFQGLLGTDAYRQSVLELLSRASPRDCAAAGFGCTRRIDRACRAPEVCSREPDTDAASPGRREGPIPGACDAFWGYYGNHLKIHVKFAGGSGHRAVFWTDRKPSVGSGVVAGRSDGKPSVGSGVVAGRSDGVQDSARLWVDGVPVGAEHFLDSSGYWVGDRFFVVDAQGPDDHPAQRFVPGELVTTVVSVLIHDAERSSTRLLVPRSHELWTDPCVRHDGDSLYVYPDPAARDADRPDRTVPTR